MTSRPLFSEINVTPLCDIFVVLLIVFMLAMDARSQQGPAVQMPRAGASASEARPCQVTLTPDLGSVRVDGRPCLLEELPARLQDLAPAEVMVRSDGEVPLERVVTVIGIARGAGIPDVGLAASLAARQP